MAFVGRNIVSINDFSNEEILFILDKAKELKEKNQDSSLTKKQIAECFFENSTRTHESFRAAAQQLGMDYVGFPSPGGTSVMKNESLRHTIKMYEGYDTDVLVLRHPLDGSARAAANELKIPVINAGDGKHEHPTQTLLDLFTIREVHGRIDHLNIACVGDLKYGRTVHSLVLALSRFPGNKFTFISPSLLKLPERYTTVLQSRNVLYEESEDVNAIAVADIVYVTRIQAERIDDENERLKVRGKLKITADVLGRTRESTRVLHPLPIDKLYPEIDPEVDTHPKAYYFEQARNGLFVRKALLLLVLDPSYGAHATPALQKEESKQEFLKKMELLPHRERSSPSIYKIEAGTVIDNIDPGQGDVIKELLELPVGTCVLHGTNLSSASSLTGRKDLLKIVNYDLSSEQMSRVAVASAHVRISKIREGVVSEKWEAHLPDEIRGILECPNEKCISKPKYAEGIASHFRTVSHDPDVVQCVYCDALASRSAGEFKIQF